MLRTNIDNNVIDFGSYICKNVCVDIEKAVPIYMYDEWSKMAENVWGPVDNVVWTVMKSINIKLVNNTPVS